MSRRGISVLICTYNGSSRIVETLHHLSRQQIPPGVRWELIVVDNNSSDNVGQIVTEEWKALRQDIPLKVLHQPRPGVTFARALGISAAEYEYLVFCDDDNHLAENYLGMAFQLMESDPTIGALGGRSDATSDVAFPDWFPDYSFGYAVGSQAETAGDVSGRGFVWGAGMCTRRSVLNQFYESGYTPLLSGRSGELLLAGDDSEICRWLLLEGYKLWYDERLAFSHFIPAERLTEAYRDALLLGFEKSLPVLEAYDVLIADRLSRQKSNQDFLRGTLHLLRGMYARIRNTGDVKQHLLRAQLRFGRYLPLSQPLCSIMKMVGPPSTR